MFRVSRLVDSRDMAEETVVDEEEEFVAWLAFGMVTGIGLILGAGISWSRSSLRARHFVASVFVARPWRHT